MVHRLFLGSQNLRADLGGDGVGRSHPQPRLVQGSAVLVKALFRSGPTLTVS